MPIENEVTDEDRIALLDEWSSGRLHGPEMEALMRVKKGKSGRGVYRGPLDVAGQYWTGKGVAANPTTLGTIYHLAAEHDYKGLPPSAPPPIIGNLDFDALIPDNDPSPAGVTTVPFDATNPPEPEETDVFASYLVNELDAIPDPAWLIRDVVSEGGLGLTYGKSGSLKTFLVLDKILHGAVGKTWAANAEAGLEGYKVARPLRVAIVAGEGARGLKRRIHAWLKEHGYDDKVTVLIVPVMPRFGDAKQVKKLARTILAKLGTCDYVVIDTLMRASLGLNVSLPSDSQIFWNAAAELGDHLKGAHVEVVHHTGKDAAKGPLGAENHIAVVDQCDCVELADKTPGRRVIVVTNEKTKDAELRPDLYFEARPREIGQDPEGRPIASLVLRRIPEPDKSDSKAVDKSRSILGMVHGYEEGERAKVIGKALEIIHEANGRGMLTMNLLAMTVAKHLYPMATEGELEREKENIRKNFLTPAVKGGDLAAYGHKLDPNRQRSEWVFKEPAPLSAADDGIGFDPTSP